MAAVALAVVALAVVALAVVALAAAVDAFDEHSDDDCPLAALLQPYCASAMKRPFH